jgi:hypothetical protein
LLADRERILGAEHPVALTSRHNLAHAYQNAERNGEGIALYEALLGDKERILGAEHPDTLRTRNKLARAYQTSGLTARRRAHPQARWRRIVLSIERQEPNA